MDDVSDYVRDRITAAAYTGDIGTDLVLRESAQLWGDLASVASSLGWVKPWAWALMSDELLAGILRVSLQRLEDKLDGTDHQQAGTEAGALSANHRPPEC